MRIMTMMRSQQSSTKQHMQHDYYYYHHNIIPLSSQDAIATRLAQDRPTMDAAIKSFLSLTAARNLTRNDDRQS